VKFAFIKDPITLKFAGKKAVLSILSESPFALEFVKEEVKDDVEVVKVAFTKDPISLKFAGKKAVISILSESPFALNDILMADIIEVQTFIDNSSDKVK
jgi:hypothetical protein